MTTAVLFDLDGTLIDTTQAILESMVHTVRLFTGKTLGVSELRPFLGVPLDDTLRELLPKHFEEAREEYVRHNLGVHGSAVKAFPGALDTVRSLQEMDYPTALVTSKRRRSAEADLTALGFSDLFRATVCYDDTEAHKPDPEPILLALERIDMRSGRAFMVGDSIWDIRAAKNADSRGPVRVISVGAAYGPTGGEALKTEAPEHLIHNIGELIPIVTR